MNRRKYKKQLEEFLAYWYAEGNKPLKPRKFPGIRPKNYRKPMVIHEHTAYKYPVCPRCSGVIESTYALFCSSCGQRLVWPIEIRCKRKQR